MKTKHYDADIIRRIKRELRLLAKQKRKYTYWKSARDCEIIGYNPTNTYSCKEHFDYVLLNDKYLLKASVEST